MTRVCWLCPEKRLLHTAWLVCLGHLWKLVTRCTLVGNIATRMPLTIIKRNTILSCSIKLYSPLFNRHNHTPGEIIIFVSIDKTHVQIKRHDLLCLILNVHNMSLITFNGAVLQTKPIKCNVAKIRQLHCMV